MHSNRINTLSDLAPSGFSSMTPVWNSSDRKDTYSPFIPSEVILQGLSYDNTHLEPPCYLKLSECISKWIHLLLPSSQAPMSGKVVVNWLELWTQFCLQTQTSWENIFSSPFLSLSFANCAFHTVLA
jgi:hypothetical protein